MKYCVIKNCVSHLPLDKTKKQIAKPPSMFKVPTCPAKRQLWIEAVAQDLKCNQYLCELHFREEDIKKKDVFTVNGETVSLPMERWRLKSKDVIPMEIRDNIKKELSVESEVSCNSHMNDLEMTDAEIQCMSEPMDQQPAEVSISFSDIFHQETLSLPSGWCWFIADGDIFFSCQNVKNRSEKIRIKWSSDLKLMISFAQKEEQDFDTVCATIDDILSTMKHLESYMLCTGTGFNERFAQNCIGVLLNDAYQRQQRFPRCKECRKLRQILQVANNRCKPLSFRISGSRRKVECLRKQTARLHNKLGNLYHEIEGCRKKCAKTQEEFVAEEIATLPPSQQSAVKACISAAKCKSGKARR